MIRKLTTALFCLFAAAAVCGGERGKVLGAESFDLPEWFKSSFLDIADDAAEAGGAGRHLMLFFHLENCPYCAKMLADSFSGANREFITAHFDVVDIDIRGAREVNYGGEEMTEREFARAVGVQYTPTLLFLDSSAVAALTVGGYRSPPALRAALRYVRDGAYREMPLADYAAKHSPARYQLRPHPDFNAGADLSAATRPLMVIVEDDTCADCEWMHKNILHKPDVREQLRRLAVARLDAKSPAAIVSPAGKKSTQAEFAASLGLHYRPGAVFFDGGREVLRLTGLLNRYHFREAARYAAGRHKEKYGTFGAYLRARREELLAAGETVDYSIR